MSQVDGERCNIFPFIKTMRAFGTIVDMGCFPKPRFQNNRFAWLERKWIRNTWPVFIFLITWLNFFRVMISFNPSGGFSTRMFLQLVVLVWYFQCCWNAVTCLVASSKCSLLPTFMKMWIRFVDKHYPLPISTPREQVDRKVSSACILWLGISAMFIFCNVPLILYILFSTDAAIALVRSILTSGIGDHPVINIILTLNQIIAAGMWVLPLGLYAVVCHILTVEFNRVCKELQGAVDRGTESFWKIVEKERGKHDDLCHLVQITNSTFQLYTASSFMTNICMVCLIIYMILWPSEGKKETYIYILNTFLLIMDALNLFIVIVMGAKLHESIHKPAQNIFSFNANIRDEEGLTVRMMQLNLFLFRLQGPAIGLTVVGLFTITMASLLSVTSVFVTFFVLLLRFQMSGADAGANATTVTTVSPAAMLVGAEPIRLY